MSMSMIIRVGERQCYLAKTSRGNIEERTISSDSGYPGFTDGNVEAKATMINDLEICRQALAEAIEGIRNQK